MHFRYAFIELANGKSPSGDDWLIQSLETDYSSLLGDCPRDYTEEQKEAIALICTESSLTNISSSCKFPDWLGYLGLVLYFMKSESDAYKQLTKAWASQLLGMVSEYSMVTDELKDVVSGRAELSLSHLEGCESELNRIQRRHRRANS